MGKNAASNIDVMTQVEKAKITINKMTTLWAKMLHLTLKK
jgi:hypothetical protein